MKFHHIAKLFYEWGWDIKVEYYTKFSDYLRDMCRKNRVMVVTNNDLIEAVILFYLTNDFNKLYRKLLWEVVDDDPNGTTIYIDKFAAKKFTRDLHNRIVEAIEERFPQVNQIVYHRAPADRCIKIRIGEKAHVQG